MKFFRSSYACLAFSQFKKFDKVVVAIPVNDVYGFRPIGAANGQICVTQSGVIQSLCLILAKHDASLNGLLLLFVRTTPSQCLNVLCHAFG